MNWFRVGAPVLLVVLAAAGCDFRDQNVHVFEAPTGPEKSVRAALQSAIDEAVAAGPGASLRIKPGVYRLEVPREERNPYALRIQNASDLTILAKGAEFIVESPVSGFVSIQDSDGVTLRGLTVDYDPLPFTAGRIVEFAEDRGSFVFEPLEGYPLPDHWQFAARGGWGYFLDPDIPGRLADGMPNVVFETSVESLPGGVFRYHFERPVPLGQAPRTEGILFTRIVKTGQLIFSTNSRRLRFEDITSFASPSGHYVGNNCEDIFIANCHAMIRGGRVKGGNADGVHFQNTRGPIVVTRSSFIGISDDGINLYQKPHFILGKEGPDRLSISGTAERATQRPGSGAFRAGDRITAFDDHTGWLSDPVEVLSFDRETGILELAGPLKLPDDPEGWARIGLYGDGFSNQVTITQCKFADSRRFGVYLKSHDAVVSDNLFLRLSASAIVAMNDTNHGEGAGTHGLLIENNRIEECGFSANFLGNKHWQAVSVFAQIHPHRITVVPGFHSEIILRNNRVIQSPRGFFLQSILGLTIEGNTFQSARDQNPEEVPVDLDGSEMIAP